MLGAQHFTPMASHPAVARGAVCRLDQRVWSRKNTRIRAGGLSAPGGASRA